ncbi:MAG: hypothetical protein SWY16_16030 [Cyanobacteriota bacterium]|nr:hypothetical protein [Cyanobacteriota bacterium]
MTRKPKNVTNNTKEANTIDIDPLTFFAIVTAVILIPLILAGFWG